MLTELERQMLAKLARSNTASVRVAQRAKIVLMAADGMDNTQIAEALGVGRVGVGRWRDRYVEIRDAIMKLCSSVTRRCCSRH